MLELLFPGKKRTVTELLWLLAVGMILVWLSHWSLSDYGNYYYGSRFLLDGKFNASVYDPWSFNVMIEQFGEKGLYENYTPVPPFSAVFYVPFAFFSPGLSKIIFSIFGLLVFATGVYSCDGLFKRVSFGGLIVLLVWPLLTNIEAGQTYLLLAGMLLLGWRFYHDKKYLWAALLWGIAIHLKVSPAIVVVFLLFEKDWKMLAWLTAAVVVLFLVTLPVIPFSIWKTYALEILPRLSQNEVNDPFTSFAQTPATFLRQLFVRDALLNPAAPFDAPQAFVVLNAICSVLLLAGAALVSSAKQLKPFTRFAFWIFTGMLASGYSTGYGIFLLLLPMIAIGEERPGKKGLVIILLLAASSVLLIHLFAQSNYFLRYLRLWLMLAAWIWFIVLLRPSFRFSFIGILICLLPLFRIFRPQPEDNSRYLLDKEVELLTGDYQWKNDSLVMEVRNGRGIATVIQSVPGAASTDERLAIRDNQLFFEGQQLTFTPDRKKKPQLMSTGDIVYLSDKNRGVGFYALRVLPFRK